MKAGDIVPGNSHFDTTKGHIEYRKAKAYDCTIAEAFDTALEHPFKGNVDIDKLETVIKNNLDKVSFIIMTVTCNSSGGQPLLSGLSPSLAISSSKSSSDQSAPSKSASNQAISVSYFSSKRTGI